MVKTILLSLKPKYFKFIFFGFKRYEYRKRFCDEPTLVYLYLSSPIKKVIGLLEFQKPINLELVKRETLSDEFFLRIQRSLGEREKYAIPIQSLRLFQKPIDFKTLKQIQNNFCAPQLYLCLKNYPCLEDYFKSQILLEKEFFYKHDKIYSDFCMLTSEISQLSEFKKCDFKNNKRYSLIKDINNLF